MATTLKELTQKRTALVEERERLMQKGDGLRLSGAPLGEVKDRIEAIEGEMRGLNPDYKQLRREHGQEAATRMMGDVSYVALVKAALAGTESWAALKLTTDAARGSGVAIPPLPPFAEEQVRQSVLWLQFLTRLGLDAATIPPSLGQLAGGEAQ